MVAALSLLCGATTSTSTPWVSRFSACAFCRASSLLATCTSTLAPRDSAWATNWSRSRCQRSSRTVSSERPITIRLAAGPPALFGWQPDRSSAMNTVASARRMPGILLHDHLEVAGALEHSTRPAIDRARQAHADIAERRRVRPRDRVRGVHRQAFALEANKRVLARDVRSPDLEMNVGQ